MPEIHYNDLKGYLKKLKENRKKESIAPVYLIYGEELLCNTTLDALLDVLIPLESRGLNYDPMDGANENIRDAIERVNTYSLLSGTKVVAICDSKIFYSKQDESRLIDKARVAFDSEDMDKAVKYLLSLLGILNLSFDDIRGKNREKTLNLNPEQIADSEWIDELIEHCEENNLLIPPDTDHSALLQKAIEKGFPEGNHLVLTTDRVDKRRTLYNSILKEGVIINCSVPKGDRRADKVIQDAVLRERMEALLDKSGKIMDKNAYPALVEMTGFDLRIFSENIKKLVSYTGDRKNITEKDVEDVLSRTKKDPIYALTNAVSDRNIEAAFFFLNSLLAESFHPLQILSAVTNQVRKLLLVRGFLESSHGSSWYPGITYGSFKSKVMPMIQKYDSELLNQIEDWEKQLSKNVSMKKQGTKKKKQKKKKSAITDLIIISSAQHPFPVYNLLLKSEKFTTNDLVDGLEKMSEADFRLKSTRQSPKLVLEEAILKICNPVST